MRVIDHAHERAGFPCVGVAVIFNNGRDISAARAIWREKLALIDFVAVQRLGAAQFAEGNVGVVGRRDWRNQELKGDKAGNRDD